MSWSPVLWLVTVLTEFVDPYLDPATGLLKNRVGATRKVALDRAEGDLAFTRLMQLVDHPVPATGDLLELQTTICAAWSGLAS